MIRIEDLYKIYLECGGRVSTDSRAIKGGELFFALRGENFDGNAYAAKALEAGAAKAVVSDSGLAGPDYILVDDTLAALQQLARYHRDNIFGDAKHLTVIGLTGTNGKTTTKELIREVLATKYKVSATQGNLNNDIGVPLTILGMGSDTEIAVVEMGASHPDDIEKLVKVSAPDYGLITNVGRAHILGFGSFEGVKAAKGALYDFIAANGGTIFLNADDADLSEMASQRRNLSIIPYGINYWDIKVLPSDADHPFLRMAMPEVLETHLVGAYNATNVLAAMAVGLHFGVTIEEAMDAIAAYEPANKRSQMVRSASNTIIVDAYNANPSSMAVALQSFADIGAPRKAVMLGQMGELGSISLDAHIEVVEAVRDLPEVYLVGDEFARAIEKVYGAAPVAGEVFEAKPGLLWFNTSEELAEYTKQHPVKGAAILLKGSRSQKMETVLDSLVLY